MKSLSEIGEFYQERFGFSKTYSLSENPSQNLKLTVVIPCLDENPEKTLESLGNCSLFDASEVEVILVFNHSEIANSEIKQKHQKQASDFDSTFLKNKIKVFSLSAFDLPMKHAGVGLARKIGMDAVLRRFSKINHDGLIVCLDADCTVSENYLETLLNFEKTKGKAASIYFEHPLKTTENEEVLHQILDYEIWLRHYIQALRWCGYPNAFHTIGSSMAVRSSTYAKAGGMNRRKAGEDFYFLHKLIPLGGFVDLTDCTVFPSSRTSERVPFGTGRAMLEMQNSTKDFSKVHHSAIFQELKEFIQNKNEILNLEFEKFPNSVLQFFIENNFKEQLISLKNRSKMESVFWKNFWQWFDGFKMLKYVHFARDNFFGLENSEEACSHLFQISASNKIEVLERLRALDRQSNDAYF